MEKIRLGMMSFAHYHANFWAEAISRSNHGEIVGIWDDDRQRGQEKAQFFGTRFFPHVEALLEQDLDGVCISSETSRHCELTLLAGSYGKHILCEKPMATTIGECETMVAAVRSAKIIYMQSFPKRLDPVNHKIKEIVEGGILGRVGMVRVRHGNGYHLQGHNMGWLMDAEFAGGGAFLDEGVHGADFLRWILGDPLQVTASIATIYPGSPSDDNGIAIYRFQNGILGELAASGTWLAATNNVEIYGDRGSLILKGVDLASREVTGDDSLVLYLEAEKEKGWQLLAVPCQFKKRYFHQLNAERFIHCLQTGDPPPATAEDGLKAQAMILKAYESSKIDRTVWFHEGIWKGDPI
jgi:myo-inositol 2-dehydrogenase / D-chiro-inositol 1-dehydrogenase